MEPIFFNANYNYIDWTFMRSWRPAGQHTAEIIL